MLSLKNKGAELLFPLLAIVSIFFVSCVSDHRLVSGYFLPKAGSVLIVLLIAAGAATAGLFLARKKKFYRTAIDAPILALLIAGILSAVFSVNVYQSFFGAPGAFTMSFVALVIGVASYSFFINALTTPERVTMIYNAFLATSIVSGVLFLINQIFHPTFFAYVLPGGFNTVDDLNGPFALWIAVTVLMAFGRLIARAVNRTTLILSSIVVVVGLAALWAVNFPAVWLVLAGGLMLTLVGGCSDLKETHLGRLSVAFGVFVFIVVGLLFGIPSLRSVAVPSEAVLSSRSSADIVMATMKQGMKTSLVGSGLGSFAVDFSRFRSAAFNTDPIGSNLRFDQPYSMFFAVLAEGGLFLLAAWVAVVGYGIYYGAMALRQTRSLAKAKKGSATIESNGSVSQLIIASVPWLALTAAFFIFSFTFPLWWLWWVTLAVFMATMGQSGQKVILPLRVELDDAPEKVVPYAFGAVLGVVLGAIIVVTGIHWYQGELHFARALTANDLPTAEKEYETAVAKNDHVANYHNNLAQLYLIDAANNKEAIQTNPTVVQNLLQKSFQEIAKGLSLSPSSVAVWQNAGMIYQNIMPLASDAKDLADKAFNKALELEPSNPTFLVALGNDNALVGSDDTALVYYQKAIALKADYVDPYVGMATIYEKRQDYNKAIALYETIIPQINADPTVLYNYGRLLYNRNQGDDRSNAETVWKLIITNQPDNADALYSLGMLAESEGRIPEALQYYQKVAATNADNQAIKDKIAALGGTVSATSTGK